MSDAEHFVQFYETDAFLLNSLSGFISTGLGAGDGCIVVANKAHRDGLEQKLSAEGLDLATARARGQYVTLDPRETLAQFTIDGVLEPQRFSELMGRVIAQTATAAGRRVRIFGDMVALLCGEGNHEAAIRLEEFWNDLGRAHAFSLFCAYPMHGFGDEASASSLKEICAQHSRVIPAESYNTLDDTDDRLRAITLLQQKARSLEAEITERKEAEERLRVSLLREQAARVEAETANRLKDEFLATVSHELRTPLTAILGWSHMLQHSELDGATMLHGLEVIERNAKAQAQLVEDILDTSRVIMGKIHLKIEPVNVAAIIRAAIDSVQLAAESRNLQLEIALDPAAPAVLGDASRLQQVIWNLLSNAIKFTPEGGRVRVQMERSDSFLQISISDTGDGIGADFLPFIFDRFRQADGTITRQHGGLGLGLALVQQLIELHGGTIAAKSEGAGHGTTFTIKLPLAPAGKRGNGNGASLRHETTAAATPSLAGVQILLVDDDGDTGDMLAYALMTQQATVQTAASAAEALELLDRYKADVLVSDLAMPGEDGYSLISKVRQLDRQLPAIALTAHVRVEDRARALSAGFSMYVPKPVEPNELIAAIANLLTPLRTEKISHERR